MVVSTAPILVPLDGSDYARQVLPYAQEFARLWRCPVQLLAVVETVPGGVLPPLNDGRADVDRVRRTNLDAYLRRQCGTLAAAGIEASAEIAAGEPAEAIATTAARNGARAIALATHGRGGPERMVLGSVADKVIRSSACPALVITPRAGTGLAATPRVARFRRLLVPLDGSTLAETALPFARDLAVAAQASILLVRVEPWLSRWLAGYEFVPDLDVQEHGITEVAIAYLERAKQSLPTGVVVETLVLRGGQGPQLTECALHSDVDLVIMTTNGRGGLRRLVLGSTADLLIRAGAPVLLLRHPAPAETQQQASEGASVQR